jgi:type VI secretion system protein ImpH
LRLAHRDRYASLLDMVRRGLRVRGTASLGFPASDLEAAAPLAPPDPLEPSAEGLPEEGPGGAPPDWPSGGPAAADRPLYDLTVTFMGLSGASSPLPPFYARQLLEDSLNDDRGGQALFDLVAGPSYRGHAAAHFHNQLPFRLLEEGDESCLHMLRSLMGLGGKAVLAAIGSSVGDLAFMALFATQFRTARGLLSYVGGRFGLSGIEMEHCVDRRVLVPKAERCALGKAEPGFRSLGQGAVLGRLARDRSSMFRLAVPVGAGRPLSDLMPGGALRASLERAVDWYLTSPLVYELRLDLAPGAAAPARLGQGFGLGRGALLAPDPLKPHSILSPASGRRAP